MSLIVPFFACFVVDVTPVHVKPVARPYTFDWMCKIDTFK